MMRRFFRTKSLDRMLREAESTPHRLNRSLGAWQLTSLGIGAIVGAGIFSSVGSAAAGGANHPGAGPAIIISFLLVAVACGFAGLCYAEFASMVPTAGSAYTYAYATLGELVAWLVGWNLVLEYAVGNVAGAISWSAYFQELLRGFGVTLPGWLGVDYRTAVQAAAKVSALQQAGGDLGTLSASVRQAAEALGNAPHLLGLPLVFNLPAVLIVILVTWILVIGIRESAWWNTAMVVLKLGIIALFLVVGAFYVQPANWTPFAPNGVAGVSSAAAIIFFAYIGFDAITTVAEETRRPQRDLPIGILASLIICTVIYVAVALVLTGMSKWDTLGTAEPLAAGFAARGVHWTAGLISAGAVIATTSVLLVFQLGQPRIFMAMARDGLLPDWAARIHPRYKSPHLTTIWTGVAVGFFSAISNLDEVVELTNIGTLFAFALVSVGIIILRRTEPDRPRLFRTPWVPWIPLLSAGGCVYLSLELPKVTWWRFFLWTLVGLIVYLTYGARRSRLNSSL